MLRTTGEVLKELINRLKYALLWVKDFPKLVKGTVEIFPQIAGNLGHLSIHMRSLSVEGAMLVKGSKEGDLVPKYYLLFRNTVLESGSLQEMGIALKRIIQEGKADLARLLNRLFWTKTGTGGTFNYLTEVTSTRIFGQGKPMSCAAACVRQFVKDVSKEDIVEAVIREKLDTTSSGTYFKNIAPILQELLPNENIVFSKIKHLKSGDPEAVRFTMKKANGPFIAQMINPRTNNPSHTIIVEKIDGDIVHLLDPGDPEKGFGTKFGVEATINIKDFAYFWDYAGAYFVYIAK